MWMFINCSVLKIVCHYSFDFSSPFELVSFSDTSPLLFTIVARFVFAFSSFKASLS